ncbi:MAG TPA: hypothetical protein VNS09_14140 [Solirubrobacter sp.]|nr:hypothetical protein [Solirubrobacter sp.]
MTLAIAAAALLPADATARAPRPCPPGAAHLLVADVDTRVYRVTEYDEPAYYACMTRRRARRFIGADQEPNESYTGFRLATPYVAYVYYWLSTAGSGASPTILNVRTGATAHIDVPEDAVHALEVTRRGGLLVLYGGPNPRSPFPPKQPARLVYRARLGQQLTFDTGDRPAQRHGVARRQARLLDQGRPSRHRDAALTFRTAAG